MTTSKRLRRSGAQGFSKHALESYLLFCILAGFSFLIAINSSGQTGSAFLRITNGYFWDPTTTDYFIPRGVAYQIWNPPVGANQSTNQVNYDLIEFKKIYANSVRAELTWGQVEIGPNQFDWAKPDFLVTRAEQLGLKLFVIIGYQYPPSWFPANLRGINNLGLREDVVQCLAKASPSSALSCLPPPLAAYLQATNSPQVLTQVLNCLVTGAKAGGVSNILACLEATLSQDELAANVPHLVSDVINYEDPQAQAVYSNYIYTVTARYKNSTAIGAWILGNEYAYFDLWEENVINPAHRYLGYDPISQKSFRSYLQLRYQTNIAALNANWLTNYTNFDSVIMPLQYPPDRYLPGYHDLIQWRKGSIGNYAALGAAAAQQADPNHLRTYSMVGGIYSGQDDNYACEDARAIVGACANAGARLHFWSINNYPWASLGSDMRSAAFGIAKYQAQSGLPVMISETGYSSTETSFDKDPMTGLPIAGTRQPKALPSTMWESLLAGAIGIHFFNWNDRSQFTQAYFYRERGFGIVQENRLPKQPVFDNVVAMFRQMQNIHLDHLLGGSIDPRPDVQFFWSTNSDMVWPRANQENALIFGAVKRLGFQARIIDDDAFDRGAFTNAPALLLSRCYQLDPQQLQRLATDVIPAGINVHAEADLPGQFDAYDRPNANWSSVMSNVFGINVSQASVGVDLIVTQDCSSPIHLVGVNNLGTITNGYAADLATWKLWRKVAPVSAKVILTASGTPFSNPACPYLDTNPYPALLVNSNGATHGKAAVNPFAFGDTYATPTAGQWEIRYAILHAIYRDHFGLKPAIDLTGTNSDRVLPAYRLCANGSVLVALLNEDINAATVTVSAPTLLMGRTVEDLFRGGILSRNSNGTLTYTVQGDDCVVLYAYPSNGSQDASLISANPNKLWFEAAPEVVWPSTAPINVTLGYDTKDPNLNLAVTLEQVWPYQRVLVQSTSTNVTGQGTAVAQLVVPDPDPNNPTYLSSPEGGQYVLHAFLARGGVPVTDLTLPMRLVFGVHPTQPFPTVLVPGSTHQIELAWEELPSYASGDALPLDRSALWDSLSAGQEHYSIVLDLLNSAGSLVASNSFLTSQGTGSNTFSITVPNGATGPFTWNAYVQSATNVLSHNVQESFEGYERGANWNLGQPYNPTNFLDPWHSFSYVYPPTPPFTNWQNEGVQLGGSDGSQSAFIVATNPAWVTVGSIGMTYQFPNDWALPADRSQWTNYLFSYDFMESHGYTCSVEMQVKNDDPQGLGKWIQYTNLYSAGSNGWFSLKASLDQFQPPPGLFGVFDPTNVHALALSIRMLTPNVQYVCSFDNIHFSGPETNLGGGVITSLDTSANDSVGWLSIGTSSTGFSVSWIGSGTLQSATNATGPWLDITNATNPFQVGRSAARQFYRLRR